MCGHKLSHEFIQSTLRTGFIWTSFILQIKSSIVFVQVASRVFNILKLGIHVNKTSTACVPNFSPTAATVSSDIYGMAVMLGLMTAISCLVIIISIIGLDKMLQAEWKNWYTSTAKHN